MMRVVDIMKTNVEKVLERDQKLSELDDRAVLGSQPVSPGVDKRVQCSCDACQCSVYGTETCSGVPLTCGAYVNEELSHTLHELSKSVPPCYEIKSPNNITCVPFTKRVIEYILLSYLCGDETDNAVVLDAGRYGMEVPTRTTREKKKPSSERNESETGNKSVR
uniref:Uncharacterized protein n=1 Tax=Timema cristinae TaxID=61476 RepID=A0A7R9CRQ6_TIMCR|nr:unnamed protein product [Timema cristinae]